MIEFLFFIIGCAVGGLFVRLTLGPLEIFKPHHVVCDTCGAEWDESDPRELPCERCGNYTLLRKRFA